MNILFSLSLSGPLSSFKTYDVRTLCAKLKEVENLVQYKYMRQNGHSQDITSRDEEDVTRLASKCMEYLESLKDAHYLKI